MQKQIARWPTFFKDKSLRLEEERSNKWFDVKIDEVLEISTHQHDSELRKLKQNEYVLVYKYSPQSLHTVYVKNYDASTQIVECINSHGKKDQYPSIRLQDIVKLYRVTCTALDAGIETLLNSACIN